MNDFTHRVLTNVASVLIGKEEVTRLALAAALAGGHVLLEDAPGTGKTMLARALAVSLGLSFGRVQFTPDLLPSDVTGVSVYRPEVGSWNFVPGPVFTQVLLADEINRATPRTQSALLEAMGEAQVTENGQTHRLVQPFFVIATQNPVEHEGTFRLPEAQLDRFLLKLGVGYPSPEEETAMLGRLRGHHPIETLGAVSAASELLAAREGAREVHVSQAIREYITGLVAASRAHPDLILGAGPRASLALMSAAQALAWTHGRAFVLPDDVKLLASAALAHRLVLRTEARLRGVQAQGVVAELVRGQPVPVEAAGA